MGLGGEGDQQVVRFTCILDGMGDSGRNDQFQRIFGYSP